MFIKNCKNIQGKTQTCTQAKPFRDGFYQSTFDYPNSCFSVTIGNRPWLHKCKFYLYRTFANYFRSFSKNNKQLHCERQRTVFITTKIMFSTANCFPEFIDNQIIDRQLYQLIRKSRKRQKCSRHLNKQWSRYKMTCWKNCLNFCDSRQRNTLNPTDYSEF